MKLMGHRGARDRALENTLRSFSFLIESGLPAVEFDIHQTSDGVWVVHHDDTLERTTTGTGALREKTWKDLSSIRTLEGDPLPRLEEVLELFAKTNIELQIELKSPGEFSKLQEIISARTALSQATIISFNHRWLLAFKQAAPQIRTTCLLFGLPINPVEIVRQAHADGLSLSVNWIDREVVEQCHKEHLKVTAWNANDEATFRKMKALGVDYLGTDRPFSAREWI